MEEGSELGTGTWKYSDRSMYPEDSKEGMVRGNTVWIGHVHDEGVGRM